MALVEQPLAALFRSNRHDYTSDVKLNLGQTTSVKLCTFCKSVITISRCTPDQRMAFDAHKSLQAPVYKMLSTIISKIRLTNDSLQNCIEISY